MKRVVMLDASEWDRLPARLAAALHELALAPGGFRIVSRETGEEIVDRLGDWLVGTLTIAFSDLPAD